MTSGHGISDGNGRARPSASRTTARRPHRESTTRYAVGGQRDRTPIAAAHRQATRVPRLRARIPGLTPECSRLHQCSLRAAALTPFHDSHSHALVPRAKRLALQLPQPVRKLLALAFRGRANGDGRHLEHDEVEAARAESSSVVTARSSSSGETARTSALGGASAPGSRPRPSTRS